MENFSGTGEKGKGLFPGGRPLLILLSAPSGAGKTTLCNMLRAEFPTIRYSISCTTRPRRGEEQDGVHYYFLTPDEFQRRYTQGEFLESAEVHGYRYGTLRKTVIDGLSAGHDVLMAIDVQGAAQIRRQALSAPADDAIRRAFVDIFVIPPSMDALRERLRGRGEDHPEVIERRLITAAEEMNARRDYAHVIVNDDLETAYQRLREIMIAEHRRST